MHLLLWALLLWTLIAALSLAGLGLGLNLATAPRLEHAPALTRFPRVSLLIPARNEESNLRVLLPSALAQDYPDFEIRVLDDHSTDQTRSVAQEYGVHIDPGAPLPGDWLGKPWACWQLAQIATGEVLIFCDADVALEPQALRRTVATLFANRADALSAMPRSRLGTWSEKAFIPLLLHYGILCWFPFLLVTRVKHPWIAAGNGQWFAFHRAAYFQCGGHASVRDRIVEDIALSRRVKQVGLRMVFALGVDTLAVRMYRNFSELREGFGKNLFFLVGVGWARPVLVLSAFAFQNALPLFFPFILHRPLAWLPLGLLLTIRLIAARALREPLSALLWHPVGCLLFPALSALSWKRRRYGGLRWKGRVLPQSKISSE